MSDKNPIRVLIVDDHAVVRSGLAAFLTVFDDLQLVGEASGGREAMQLCQQNEVDVVLMDLMMPEMNGAEATQLIRQQCPNVQVIALTSFKEEELVQGALRAGAISYLLKNVSADELANAIRAAHAGRLWLSRVLYRSGPPIAMPLLWSTRTCSRAMLTSTCLRPRPGPGR